MGKKEKGGDFLLTFSSLLLLLFLLLSDGLRLSVRNVAVGATVRIVITQIFSVPKKALFRRGATVELRPAF